MEHQVFKTLGSSIAKGGGGLVSGILDLFCPTDADPEISEPEPEPEVYVPDDISEVSLDNNFLSDLNADNYREPPTQQEIRQEEKQQKAQKKVMTNYLKISKEKVE